MKKLENIDATKLLKMFIAFAVPAVITIILLMLSIIHTNNNGRMINERVINKNLHSVNSSKTLNEYNVYKFIKFLDLEHPAVVMVQCRMESGNFKSGICLQNNNMLGMRHPGKRPNLSEGKRNGYAVYESWQYCLIDYAIWQSRYAVKYKTDEDYINFLGKIYGSDSLYVEKVNTMLNEYIKGD